MCELICVLKSSDPAVKPDTPSTFALCTPAASSGTTFARSSFSASSEVSSVPVPAIGTCTIADRARRG